MARGHGVLIVDPSGAPEFKRAREFCRKNGYSEEARIRDFWAAGIDKVIFWKLLNHSEQRFRSKNKIYDSPANGNNLNILHVAQVRC
jgi:hypothetical protein